MTRSVTLVEKEGAEAGTSFELTPPIVIGRMSTCTLPLADKDVSRRHCVVEFDAHEYVLRDLGSANGTYLNGKRVNTAALRHGDVITVGGTTLVFNALGGWRSEASHKNTRVTQDAAPVSVLATADVSPEAPPFDSVTGASGVEELSRALQKYKLVYQANELIAQLRNLDGFFRAILETLFTHLPADRGAVFVGDDPEHLSIAATHSTSRQPVVPTISRTLLGRLYEQRQALLVEDTLLDERLHGSVSLVAGRSRSIMCVPLAYGSRMSGVIQLESGSSKSRPPFDGHDLQAIAAIGRRAAIAFDGLRRHEKQNTAPAARELGRSLAPEVVEQVLQQGPPFEPRPTRCRVAVLTCRIRREQHDSPNADELVKTINRELGAINDTIARHGGTLSAQNEREVVAFWGAPVPVDKPSLSAVICALELRAAFDSGRMPATGLQIGVAVGDATVGCIGTSRRKDYVAMGRAVERAGDLAQACLPGSVAGSEELQRELGASVEGRWTAADVVRADGTKAAERVFLVDAVAGDVGGVEITVDIENEQL